MLSKVKARYSGLSKVGKGFVWTAAGVFGIATASAAVSPQHPTIKPSSTAQVRSVVEEPAVEKKTVTETAVIPFARTTVDDGNLEKGKTVIKTNGVNGVKTLTYEITYEDSVETDKKLVKEEITTAPVTQVTSVGTYVYVAPAQPSCPNGTYVNSAGDTVCSPYSSPSAPAGATARCADGTYSFSQSRSGTCSHHGGVAQWL